MKTEYDAIIVGAGPAGSTAAIRLAQAGWSVALIEQHAYPRRKVCGECIAPTNLPLLDALGIGDAFSSVAGPDLRNVGLFTGSETVVAEFPPMSSAQHRWGRALGREHLDTLLLQRAVACGAQVWQPYRVIRVGRSAERKTCALTGNGESVTLSAPVMIAANGSWSADPFSMTSVRRQHKASDLFAFKGTYRHSSLPRGLLPVMAFPGGYGGLVIGDHDTLTLAFCIRRDVLFAWRKQRPATSAAAAAEAYVLQHCPGAREALRNATSVGKWLSVGPLNTGIRTPWRADHYFAIGNAAGEAHPILGEGISMAIQSAWLLGDLLTHHRDELLAGRDSGVGRAYAKRWNQNFSSRIRVAAVYAHMAMSGPLMKWVTPIIKRWPKLITIGARLGAKVRQFTPLHARSICNDSSF